MTKKYYLDDCLTPLNSGYHPYNWSWPSGAGLPVQGFLSGVLQPLPLPLPSRAASLLVHHQGSALRGKRPKSRPPGGPGMGPPSRSQKWLRCLTWSGHDFNSPFSLVGGVPAWSCRPCHSVAGSPGPSGGPGATLTCHPGVWGQYLPLESRVLLLDWVYLPLQQPLIPLQPGWLICWGWLPPLPLPHWSWHQPCPQFRAEQLIKF